jgi:hypothetical protein
VQLVLDQHLYRPEVAIKLVQRGFQVREHPGVTADVDTRDQSDRMEGLVGLEISGVLAEGDIDGAASGGTAT